MLAEAPQAGDQSELANCIINSNTVIMLYKMFLHHRFNRSEVVEKRTKMAEYIHDTSIYTQVTIERYVSRV